MVWVMGIIGFIGGFFAGQMVLAYMLRNRTKQDVLDLMKDKHERLKYGMINWAIALAGAAAFVIIYRRWYG
ncbi:MAG TPA: hypothetical protein VL625_12730 [Patescibacteria group bacterium]|jgi:energy-converting hydrogenase Eha subunit G|nr:hypothetical protein [Patescibacteria group bacterium]